MFGNGNRWMFGTDDGDLVRTLGAMHTEAYNRANANKVEAHRHLIDMIQIDRRFDNLDPERLADAVRTCGETGRQLDFTDPLLKRGGQPRPQARRGLW